jgi:hypothetical protein
VKTISCSSAQQGPAAAIDVAEVDVRATTKVGHESTVEEELQIAATDEGGLVVAKEESAQMVEL